MLRSRPARISLLTLAVVLGAGCKEVIRGTTKVIGADDLADRAGAGNRDPGSDRSGTDSVVLASSSLRVVEGRGPILLTLVRKNPGSGTVTLDFESREWTGRGRATSGADFQQVWGTLRWGPMDGAPRQLTIQVREDTESEGTEVFQVAFSNARGAKADLGTVTCFIEDPAAAPMFEADVAVLSAGRGGVQRLRLRAGVEHAGRDYLIAGSFGTAPGFALAGLRVPLNTDPWFALTLQHANGPYFRDFVGHLDLHGEAAATIHSAPIPIPGVVGLRVYHAYVVHDASGAIKVVSNPVALRIIE